jgi:hypothetical protein
MLSACGPQNTANTTASCAFVVGDGSDNHDATVHAVYYPGATFDEGTYEDTKYFPCNPRTFIINPPGQKNANGQPIGDRHVPVYAYTKDNTKVRIWLTAYWTLNQSPSVLKSEFAPVCLKFSCWSGDSNSNKANFSTPGWNGMLGETISKGIDQAALVATHGFADVDLFENHDPAKIKSLGEAFSKEFNDSVRPTTGATNDLFCGSGSTSGWENPEKPGHGKFACGQVRFVIDEVEPADANLNQQVAQITGKDAKKRANSDQLEIAESKYGTQAKFWLGLQDTAKQCTSKCTIVVGSPQQVASGQ